MAREYKYPFLRLADVNAPFRDALAQAALRVIDSGYYIGGPELANFESMLSAMHDGAEAVGVTNGLDALRLIFRAYKELGALSAGDEVIVPANTYVASVLAVTDNALTPVFVEPDAQTLNLDTSLVEAAITPRTRAILPVHLYGRVCWDSTLAAVVRRHNLIVVEDNAQAIGAQATEPGLFGSRHSGALGHAGAFSFYPTKNIGALGDGGAVVTNDPKLAAAIRAIRNYGSDRQYHNIYKGLNCRLDSMKAAMLAAKLPFTDAENQYRRELAQIYNTNINNALVRKPLWTDGSDCVWHQYAVLTEHRDRFRQYLADNGVETAVHYSTPPHRQPCYAEYSSLHLPITESIAASIVSLPITRTTSPQDAAEISAIINDYRG